MRMLENGTTDCLQTMEVTLSALCGYRVSYYNRMTHIHPKPVFSVIWTQFYVPSRSINIEKNMKGDRKKRLTKFKKGNKHYLVRQEGVKSNSDDIDVVQYVRPTPEEQDLLNDPPIPSECLTQTGAPDHPTGRTVFLRSQGGRASTSTATTVKPLDAATPHAYKLYHTQKLWHMFNTVTKEHSATNPSCDGNLAFDSSKETQRGLVWCEAVRCDKCHYRSSVFKLYEEIETGKRGRRPATANVGFNIALTQTPAAASSVIKMLSGGNIPAPSARGMHKSATKVCKLIEEANTADMRRRREQLKQINRWRNLPESTLAVQSDGTYNNSLYSGVGRTPFQPATQCSYLVAENMTSKKQIIAMENVNKLCSKHGFHSADDEECDIKSGDCSATACMETNIGDEQKWAKMCFKDLHNDGLSITFLTTDPDTKAYQAAEELHSCAEVAGRKPQHQIDTRHLSENHRKQIKNNIHVLNMMPGRRKSDRQFARGRFAADISMRCQAEFESVHHEVKGNMKEMTPRIHKCISAIKRCYCADHSHCTQFSSVCKGSQNDNWVLKSSFLPPNFKIDASKAENVQTLLECIEYRLSDDMLELTRLNTNSQKVEATNRSLRRSLPKNVTFSRNFSGRAHSAVHSVNNGPGNSIRRLCSIAGCPIPTGGKVDCTLGALQLQSEKYKKRDKSFQRKMKRKLRRNKMFKLYEAHQEQKNYIRAQVLKKLRAARKVAQKSRSTSSNRPASDHDYIRNPKSNQLLRRKRHSGLCSPTQAPAVTQ